MCQLSVFYESYLKLTDNVQFYYTFMQDDTYIYLYEFTTIMILEKFYERIMVSFTKSDHERKKK